MYIPSLRFKISRPLFVTRIIIERKKHEIDFFRLNYTKCEEFPDIRSNMILINCNTYSIYI